MIRRVRKLNAGDLPLMCEILVLILVLPALKRFLSVPSLMRCLDTQPASLPGPRPAPDRLVWLTRGLLECDTGLLRPNCMTESLVLFRFLRRWGYPVSIHFGVAKPGPGIRGHCWLEMGSQPFQDSPEITGQYKSIYSYPRCSNSGTRSRSYEPGKFEAA